MQLGKKKILPIILCMLVLTSLACSFSVVDGVREMLPGFEAQSEQSESGNSEVEPAAEEELQIASPTEALQIAPPAQEEIGAIFSDDFSDPNSGWEIGDYSGGSVGYLNGQYVVSASEKGKVMWGLAYTDIDDVIVEVETYQLFAHNNDNNSYGVMCRVQPDNSGYLLRISGDGFYSIVLAEADSHTDLLVDWTRSDVINQGNASNHLIAICDGSHFALIVNGELLAETTDFTYASGDIALTSATYEDVATTVAFDNIKFLAP